MSDKVEKIKELAQLKESGALSEDEFKTLKEELLKSEGGENSSSHKANGKIRNTVLVVVTVLVLMLGYYFFPLEFISDQHDSNNNTKNETPAEFTFLGSWAGVGYQNSGSKWTIKMVLNEGDYTIEYPSLSCGGYLTVISQSVNEMIFREKITRGISKCTDGGTLTISKLNDDELIWDYVSPNNASESSSRVFRFNTEKEYDQIINLMDPTFGLKAGDCAQVTFVGKGFLNSGEKNIVRGRLTYSGTTNAFMKIVSMSNSSLYYAGEKRFVGSEIDIPKSWLNVCN